MTPPPPAGAVAIRAGRDALDLAVEWAAREGWNPGLADAEAFFAADPGGFLLAESPTGGEPLGTISVVAYPGNFGFLGFYIVRPESRGQGIGLALWQAGMARLAGRVVGLDGVVAQQANYARSGFVLAHRNIRYGGDAVAAAEAEAAPALAVVPAASLPFAAIEGFDRVHFGAPRAAFLRAWLTLPGHVALAAVRREAGEIAGLGVLRPCREGAKIGPLFAAGEAEARALFAAFAARAPAGPLFLDVPEPNAAARRLAEAAGLRPVFETARMYAGPRPAPDLPLARIFGITSFELG